jgi:hypothetical protein
MSVNPAQFNRGLASAETALGQFRSAALGVQGAIVGLGAGLAIREVAGGIGAAVKASSDLSEQVSKSRTVFGAASANVEAAAQKMGDAFGYPKAQFIEGASSIGLIAKASGLGQKGAADMGSAFAVLAADASSFYNVPIEEALGAIRSGLVGEAEPMRRFGVLLNEAAVAAEAAKLGFEAANGKLTEGAKVQARASLITKGLADAQGDLARTAEGVANMVRTSEGRWTNAMADIGAAIEPVSKKFLELKDTAVKALTLAFTENADALKAWSDDLASSDSTVTSAVDTMAVSFGSLANIFQVLTKEAKYLELGYHSLFGGLGIAVMGITKVIETLTGVNFTGRDLVQEIKDEWNTIKLINEDIAKMEAAPPASDFIANAFAKASAKGGGALKLADMNLGGKASAALKKAGTVADAGPSKQLMKTWQEADTLIAKLEEEANSFSVAGKAAEIYKLELAGATKEQIALAKSLDMEVQGLKIKEETLTPGERFDFEKKRFDALFASGDINKTDYTRGLMLKREDILGKEGVRFAGATQAGTAEAYSSQLRNISRETTKDEPIKEVARNGKEQVDVSKQMLTVLNKIADKDAAKAQPITVEVFSL